MDSTLLGLTRRLAIECGVNKDTTTSIPTVQSVVGETQRLANWIIEAWVEIQSLHQNWQFLRRSTSWVTVDGQATYTPTQCGVTAGTFGSWEIKSFRNYLTSAGQNSEIFMYEQDYDLWRNNYQFGALRVSKSRPYHITITPDKSIGLGPVPLAGYTILGDYYLAPVHLSADADTPTLPAWHNPLVIVHKAMMSYGAFSGAPEVYQRGELEYKKDLQRLEMDQVIHVSSCGALA